MCLSHNFYLCRGFYRCARESGAPVVHIVDHGGGYFYGETSDGGVLVEGIRGCCKWAMKREIAQQWLDKRLRNEQ